MHQCIITATFLFAMVTSLQAETISIQRDRYGVPYIHAESSAGAAYALGWCQAEDRLEQIFTNYATACGTLASIEGKDALEHDLRQRVFRHWQTSQSYVEHSIPPELLQEIKAFQAGIRAFMEAHPERVPDCAFPIEPAHTIALARFIIFQWPQGQIADDLSKSGKKEFFLYSNQWTLAPWKTTDGRAVLLIDPHIPYEGVFRFYEAQIEAGDDRRRGFFPVGGPYMGLGHNGNIAWACTTGGPDTADVYEIECDPDNLNRYRYDGEWRTMEIETVEIEVKDNGSAKHIERREIRRTHHGPIVAEEKDRLKVYAAKTAYDGRADTAAQMYRMNHARSLKEFQDAVAMCEFMPQNIMAASRDGHIWYCRTGRVPIRPKGYDWSVPVPGNTSKTEWLGIHPQDDLIQIFDPKCGYMQNCNISPDRMMLEGAPQASDYLPEIFNDDGSLNPRGERAMQLLSTTEKIDVKHALDIVNDTYVLRASKWQKYLQQAIEIKTDTVREAGLKDPAETILSWDGYAKIDSVGANLFREWTEVTKKVCEREGINVNTVNEFDDRAADIVLEALETARDALVKRYGKWDVSWGDVHRVERGSESYPVAGGEWRGPDGLFVTLRTINNRVDPDENGHRAAHHGQSNVMLVFLGAEGIESYTVVPYGNSDNPDSPHYCDQARDLFSQGKLKPTYFDTALPDSEITTNFTLPFEP